MKQNEKQTLPTAELKRMGKILAIRQELRTMSKMHGKYPMLGYEVRVNDLNARLRTLEDDV